MWDFLLAFLLAIPLAVALLVLGAIVVFSNPDAAKKWGAIIGFLVSYVYKKAEYVSIKWEVEGRLNSFVRNLESNIVRTFPNVKLHWATQDGKEEVLWEENKLMLFMRDRRHRTRNFVHAAYLFTSETLLKNTSFHISKAQKKSLTLFATKKVLEEQYRGVVSQFMNDHFVPQVQRSDDLKKLIAQYVDIERIGVFFPILIQEIHALGNKVFLNETRKDQTISEVNNLIAFLVDFSMRTVGSTQVPTTFVGDYTRCAIRVVASKEVRARGDVEGHKTEILGAVERSIENIYIVGSDSNENRKFVDSVVSAVMAENPSLHIQKTYHFPARIKNSQGKWINVNNYLVHLHNPEAEEFLFTRETIAGKTGGKVTLS